jgi:hypothetical protein
VPSLKRAIIRAIVDGPLAWVLLDELPRRVPHHHPDAVRREALSLVMAGVLDEWSFDRPPARRGRNPRPFLAVTLSVRAAARVHRLTGRRLVLADRLVRTSPRSRRRVWRLQWVERDVHETEPERETRSLKSSEPPWLAELARYEPPPPTPEETPAHAGNGHHDSAHAPGCSLVPSTLMGRPVGELKTKRRGKRSRTHATLNRATVEPDNPADN